MAEAAAPTPRGRARGRGSSAPRGRGYGQKRPAEYNDYEDYSSGGGYTKKRKIMDDVYRFLVREDLVRAIIGKGGDHIRMIKEEAKSAGIETKVSIYAQTSNGAPLMEGAVDRVMSVQSTTEGLAMALTNLVPSVQIHHNHKSFRGGRGGRGGGAPGQKSQKLELRLLVPAHCCSGIIGKGGSVIKRIKEETNSYIQVYTLAMPGSEEHCVRIQNFEAPDLITTAVKVFESIADIKGKNPIIMYDPIYFLHGHYGDTGSYIDTEWYQEALRSGVAKPTPYKQIRGAARPAHTAPAPSHADYTGYEEEYDYGYDEGYGYAYDEGYGYEEDYGYEEYYSYAPPAPAPRARARAAPRGAVRARATPTRGYPAAAAPRGYPPRGRGAPRGAAPRGAPRGYSRGAPRARGAPRGRGAPPSAHTPYDPEEATE